MSQSDVDVADAPGAAFLVDLNLQLKAINSLQAGALEPTVANGFASYPYQWWADTTSGLLKQRNAANTGWLVRGSLAEAFAVARSSNTILAGGDYGKTFKATSTFTQTLTAAATLGDGWHVQYRNDGTGTITLDPNSSETIDGATTKDLLPGESCIIFCDGSNFKTIGLAPRRSTVSRSSDTTLAGADHGKLFIITSGTFSQTFTAAATLADGWYIDYRNDGAGTVTLDPNASETIDGATTLALTPGQACRIFCDGAAFHTIGYPAAAAASNVGRNHLINGTFSISQRAMPTTDNAYCIDRWRLMLGAANAATVSQDTADVPSGAKYACKLVVGSGNNNKFGIFQVLENVNCAELAGKTVSILVPMKATAGLTDGTGKIRIGILQWTGTADSVSATPISAWGAEGTNPTLIANWAFANTPAALSVTTSWADYSVLAVALSASATNIGVLIWSDDKTNTQTTDILRIGGYVTLGVSATAPSAQTRSLTEELALCQRYCQKSFPLGTAPAQNAGTAGVPQLINPVGATAGGTGVVQFSQRMRAAPTIVTYNPGAANAQPRRITGANSPADFSAYAASLTTENGFSFTFTTDGQAAASDIYALHYLATAEL